MRRQRNTIEQTITPGLAETSADAFSVMSANGIGIVTTITMTSYNSKSFTADASSDQLTASAHGLPTGLKITVINSGGALPGGLLADTAYYVKLYDANTIGLATSYANALSGTVINLTTNGTGTNTIIPANSVNMKIKGSVDNGSTYGLIETKTYTVSGTYAVPYYLQDLAFDYIKITYEPDGSNVTSVLQQTAAYME